MLSFAKMVLFNIVELPYVVDRPEKYGGKQMFNTPEELEEAFLKQELSPQDLKESVAFYLNQLLDPIREDFKDQASMDLVFKAYGTKLTNPNAEKTSKCEDESMRHSWNCSYCVSTVFQGRKDYQDLANGREGRYLL